MTPGAQWIEAGLWSALWQSSACLLIGLLGAALLHRRPARAHAVLLASIVTAMLAPLLGAAFRLAGWGLLPGTSRFVGLADLAAQLSGEDGLAVSRALVTWSHAVAAAWLAATAVAGARLVASVRRGRRLLAEAVPLDDPGLHAMACGAASVLGLRVAPRLYRSGGVRCPVVWCWGGTPRLVLPAGGPRIDLSGVLFHELAHFRRRDHLASLAGEVALCLLVWNPLAWIAVRRMRDLSEHCCDAWVLAAGQSPTAYAEALLEMVPHRAGVLVPAAVNGRRAVARRIRRILERPFGEPGSGRRWRGAVFAAAALLAAGTALAQRRPPTVEVVSESGDRAPLAGPDVITIPSELDLGSGPPSQPVTRELLLCNRSEQRHAVFGAVTSCGCTTVSDFDPRTLGPGECMKVEITMTAPAVPGEVKTRFVTFDIEGQPPLKLPVHVTAAAP